MFTRWSLASLAGLAMTVSAYGQEAVSMGLTDTGAARQLGYFIPQQTPLSDKQPAAINVLPADLVSPKFAMVNFRLATGQRPIAAILDASGERPPQLYVDANANGDLTDDPPLKCFAVNPMVYEWNVKLPMGTADNPLSVNVVMDWVHDDPQLPQRQKVLFFTRDYARLGEVTLSGTSYNAALTDDLCSGDFRGAAPANGPASASAGGVFLMLDLLGNGKFRTDARERFNVLKPFNVAGTDYMVRNMTVDGQFIIVRLTRGTAINVPGNASVFAPPTIKTGGPKLPAPTRGAGYTPVSPSPMAPRSSTPMLQPAPAHFSSAPVYPNNGYSTAPKPVQQPRLTPANAPANKPATPAYPNSPGAFYPGGPPQPVSNQPVNVNNGGANPPPDNGSNANSGGDEPAPISPGDQPDPDN